MVNVDNNANLWLLSKGSFINAIELPSLTTFPGGMKFAAQISPLPNYHKWGY